MTYLDGWEEECDRAPGLLELVRVVSNPLSRSDTIPDVELSAPGEENLVKLKLPSVPLTSGDLRWASWSVDLYFPSLTWCGDDSRSLGSDLVLTERSRVLAVL